MSNDVAHGFRYIQRIDHAVDLLEKLMKSRKEHVLQDAAHEQFAKSLQGNEINENTVTFFNTKGLGLSTTEQSLKEANIPFKTLHNDMTQETMIAVPKSFQAQANAIIGFNATRRLENPNRIVQLSPQQQKYLESIKGKQPTQLTAAQATLLNKKSSVFLLQDAAAQEMSKKFHQNGIPHATIQRDGLTAVVFHPAFAMQAESIHKQITNEPSLVNYNTFIRDNMGQNMKVCSGLTEGQREAIARQLQGSCVGCCINGNNLYYTEAQASRVEPILNQTMLCKNLADKQAVNRALLHDDIMGLSKAGKEVHFKDAENPGKTYTINRSGLHSGGPNGPVIAKKTDANFERQVRAAVKSMESPICEEIAKSKEAIAKTNIEQAEMCAAQIACLGGNPDRNTLNVLINEVKLKADTMEGELTRFDADELADKLGVDPSVLEDYAKLEFDAVGLAELQEVLTNMQANITPVTKRPITKDAQALEDVNRYFESKEQEREDDIRDEHAINNSMNREEAPVEELSESEEQEEFSLDDLDLFGGNN